MDSALKTANLFDEMLAAHPTAIRHNAVRLGLVGESQSFTRQTLMQAISEKKAADNLDNEQTAALMYDLLSVDRANWSVVRELWGFTEGDKRIIKLPDWAVYLIGFLIMVGIISTLLSLGRIAKKIIS